MQINGLGCDCDVHMLLNSEDGEGIDCEHVGMAGGTFRTIVKAVTGRHAAFFKVTMGSVFCYVPKNAHGFC